MSDLKTYFNGNQGRMIQKWNHYFDIYERHFASYRNKEITILEFGVYQGGSLQMWKEYFGSKCKIYGVDINPACKELEEDGIEILIGDQGNRKFLSSIKEVVPEIDILIDDGGHTMEQQIRTFDILFDAISDGGLYLCEDTHTSYWPEWGGGVSRRGTYIQYAKTLIDKIHAWHSFSPRLPVTHFTKNAYGLHFYDSVLVIEKRNVEPPVLVKRGEATIPVYIPKVSAYQKIRVFLARARRYLDRVAYKLFQRKKNKTA